MRKRGIVLAVVAAVFAAGCGGGSSKVTAKPTTTTKPPAVPNTPKQRASDKALAKQAVLKLTDLPLGFTATPHKNSDSELPKAVERKFVACAHLPKRFLDDKSDDQPNADSPDFAKGKIGAGPAAAIESSIELDRAVKDISEPLSYLAKPNTVKCFDPFFRAAFAQSLSGEPGVKLTDFTLRALSVGSVGDESAGFQGRITLTGSRASLDIEFNLYFVRSGRAIVEMSAIAFSIPFDQSLAESLLQKMVSRLKPGLAA